MIERILDFMTSKDSIDNSKILRILLYLIMGILASTWYSHSIHKYSINIEFKFLIDFIFSGRIIPCILLYGIIYFINELSCTILFMIYSFCVYRIVKKKADIKVKTEGGIKIKKSYLDMRDFFKPLLIFLGILQIINGETRIPKETSEALIRYCDEPRTIILNLIELLVLVLMFYLAYNLKIHDLEYIPQWLNHFVTIVFWFFIISIPIISIILSILEINIPALRIFISKVRPM